MQSTGRSLGDASSSITGSRDLDGDRKDAIRHIRTEDLAELDTTYNFKETIGQGAFGIVKLCEHRTSGKTYACKLVKKRIGSTSSYDQMQREVAIMKLVHHPNIVQLKEVYESPKKMCMVMEYCSGGELVQTIRKRGSCTETEIRRIILQLIEAITYIHKHGIVHRDIKPENILLKAPNPLDPYNIKVSDFGLACFADSMNRVENVAGTPMYMAPEIVQNLGYNHSCDIWSIGVMFYLLLCNYQKEVEMLLHDMIHAGKIEYPDKYWSKINPSARNLCELILRFDPAKRISAAEILRHPWILDQSMEMSKLNTNVLDLMKSYNAERRLRKGIITVIASLRFMMPVQQTIERMSVVVTGDDDAAVSAVGQSNVRGQTQAGGPHGPSIPVRRSSAQQSMASLNSGQTTASLSYAQRRLSSTSQDIGLGIDAGINNGVNGGGTGPAGMHASGPAKTSSRGEVSGNATRPGSASHSVHQSIDEINTLNGSRRQASQSGLFGAASTILTTGGGSGNSNGAGGNSTTSGAKPVASSVALSEVDEGEGPVVPARNIYLKSRPREDGTGSRNAPGSGSFNTPGTSGSPSATSLKPSASIRDLDGAMRAKQLAGISAGSNTGGGNRDNNTNGGSAVSNSLSSISREANRQRKAPANSLHNSSTSATSGAAAMAAAAATLANSSLITRGAGPHHASRTGAGGGGSNVASDDDESGLSIPSSRRKASSIITHGNAGIGSSAMMASNLGASILAIQASSSPFSPSSTSPSLSVSSATMMTSTSTQSAAIMAGNASSSGAANMSTQYPVGASTLSSQASGAYGMVGGGSGVASGGGPLSPASASSSTGTPSQHRTGLGHILADLTSIERNSSPSSDLPSLPKLKFPQLSGSENDKLGGLKPKRRHGMPTGGNSGSSDDNPYH